MEGIVGREGINGGIVRSVVGLVIVGIVVC